jgi:hypothetical protein
MDFIKNRLWWYGLSSSGSGYKPVAGSYEHGNNASGFIKADISLLTEWLLASQERIFSMGLVVNETRPPTWGKHTGSS